MDIIIQILVGYATTCFLFSTTFGLIILLDEDLSWRDMIVAFLLMPFIVIGAFGAVIIDDIKERNKDYESKSRKRS